MIQLTKEQINNLKIEYDNLMKKINSIREELQKNTVISGVYDGGSKSFGDIPDNLLTSNYKRLFIKKQAIENIFRTCITIRANDSDIVGVGSIVKLDQKICGKSIGVIEFRLLHILSELDVKDDVCSVSSPLGGVLIGKRPGDVFSYQPPKGSLIEISILGVNNMGPYSIEDGEKTR